MILKCKMCGGDLNIENGAVICECEFCGTMQTIPALDNEKKGNLFNRANRLRRASEFDKAAAVYESIVAEFPEEAEAYWGLCLCAYGIEYVDDPASGKKMPTCHRTRQGSIMRYENFSLACEYADAVAKKLYREEAKEIDRIQQAILEIVAGEAPYDVFICYKETGADGSRTEDSVLAQDIYDALTEKGLKVFFARITLEDKLGQQYEPYIYAALHSAKVMLAVGTSFEHYDAVWVKNEWSRFIGMMKEDRKKMLIPCFKGIDAYDIPEEFQGLQAQDMGKLGWLQDLTRGVMKLCGKEKRDSVSATNVVYNNGNPTIASLLRRAEDFLENGAWNEAVQYAERILDADVENAQAYLIELLASHKVPSINELKKTVVPISETPEYKKIIRYANNDLKEQLQNCAKEIDDKYLVVYKYYEKGIELLNTANNVADLLIVKRILEKANGVYSEVSKKIEECERKIQSMQTISRDLAQNLIDEICSYEFAMSYKGYDPREVDYFLDDVCDTIANNNGVKTIIQMIERVRFSTVWSGYNTAEIENFLDSICSRLNTINDPEKKAGKEFLEAEKELSQFANREAQKKQKEAEKRRNEKKQRITDYWAAHADEKKELDNWKESLLAQQAGIITACDNRIDELNREIKALTENIELQTTLDQISVLKERISMLGIFRTKEKKLYQEQMERIQNEHNIIKHRIREQKTELHSMLAAVMEEREKALAPLQKTLQDIEEELNKER